MFKKYLSLLILSSTANSEPLAAQGFFGNACGTHSKAAELAQLIINHAQQQRQQFSCHPTLALTAAKKAKTMAQNQRVEHNLDFRAPNGLLEAHGYRLPAAFLPTSNQVESIAAGKKTPAATLTDLLNSKYHRSHVLGLSDFTAQQLHIGVGYYYDPKTPHEHYWAVHIAQPRSHQMENQTVALIEGIKNYAAKPSD